MNCLYLVSTPLHLYMASNIALSRPQDQHHLVFIDQVNTRNNPWYETARQWPLSPFASYRIFPGRIRNPLKKLLSRKQIFRAIEAMLEDVVVDEILVGNDRRIEFQYAMHVASRRNPGVQGGYMDEGTYTYVGRPASGSFADRVIDNMAKKLVYGRWWKHPPTIGGSDWINTVYVAFPDLIHPLLRHKQVVAIAPELFVATAITQLSRMLCEKAGVNESQLTDIRLLVTLPHESIYQQSPTYRDALVATLSQLSQSGLQVAAKYHPRDSSPDGLQLAGLPGVHLLPSAANFEALLPLLPTCTVVGDVSSVLLICRWLRPDIRVLAIDNGANPLLAQFAGLYDKLHIDVVKPSQLASTLERVL